MEKISPEARAFIAANIPTGAPDSQADIARLRREYTEPAEAAAPGLLDQYALNAVESRLGSVPVAVFKPRTSAREDRAVLYFFGGGYFQGGPVENLPTIAPIARGLEAPVYVPRYRLAPEHRFPAALDDGLAAYRVLLQHVEPAGIAVVGQSAGGGLALATLLQAGAEGLPLPAACALFSPSCDKTARGGRLIANDGRDPTLTRAYIDAALPLYVGEASPANPLISPVYADYSAGFPPTIITSGTRDLLQTQCEALASRMAGSGCDVQLNVWPGMWHCFEAYPEIPEGRRSMSEIIEFLSGRLPGR